ncbi:hypothetical protein BVRB_016260, partial [Beta vulgaris subsp. vulgaris]
CRFGDKQKPHPLNFSLSPVKKTPKTPTPKTGNPKPSSLSLFSSEPKLAGASACLAIASDAVVLIFSLSSVRISSGRCCSQATAGAVVVAYVSLSFLEALFLLVILLLFVVSTVALVAVVRDCAAALDVVVVWCSATTARRRAAAGCGPWCR